MRASVLFEQGPPLRTEELDLEPAGRCPSFPGDGDTRAVAQGCDALSPWGTCVLIGMPATGDANEAFRVLAAGELGRGLIVL